MAKVAILVPQLQMKELCSQLIEEYPNLTPLCIDQIHTDEASDRAAALNGTDCDLIIARGLQACVIRRRTALPVITISITAQELGLMVLDMKQQLGLAHPQIGIIGFENTLDDTSSFGKLFDMELVRYTLRDEDIADDPGASVFSAGISARAALEALVDRALQDGCHAVFGGEVVCARAAAAGLPHMLLHSGTESVRNALSAANHMGHAIDLQKQNASEINTMLDFTFSGILQIDVSGVIRRCNRVVCSLLDLHPSALLGHSVRDIFPKLQEDILHKVLCSGEEAYALLVPIENHAVVVNIAPILIEEQICGAIMTFQESHRIIEIDNRLREEFYQRGFVARYQFDQLPAADSQTRKLFIRAKRFAKFPAPVLITGEHGNGNLILAQCLHNASLAASNAFVDVDCAAFDPEDLDILLFGSYSVRSDSDTCYAEAAQKGTLCLEHVDSLPPSLQYKVLQLIRGKLRRNGTSRPICADIRVIASTSTNLVSMVEQGTFRGDLYYGLNVLSLHFPPLRERRDDILPWIDSCMREAQKRYKRYFTLTQGARDYLRQYSWPGNLDQLRGLCERIVLTAERRTIDEVFLQKELEQMAPRIAPHPEQVVVIKDPRAAELEELLKQHAGNRQAAADALGISKTTLWRRMKKYGIVLK